MKPWQKRGSKGYQIRYWREQAWARPDKPEGYATSTMPPYRNHADAQAVANHINRTHPVMPCEVVTVIA
jgi:hypothetical protein